MSDPLIKRPRPHYRWRLWGWGFIGAGVVWLLTAWLAASELSHPRRRALQDYHNDILVNSSTSGMQIDHYVLSDGTPCLFCRPSPSSNPGKRARILREQLSERRLDLFPQGIANGATLVLLHGRKGRKEDNLPVAERFCAAGFSCVLPDLPAHGDHPGKSATFGLDEASLPRKALDEAVSRFGIAPQPAGLWGMSMGGSVAVYAAAEEPSRWQALVVVASFDALDPVVARQASAMVGPWLGAAIHTTVRPIFHLQTGCSMRDVQPFRVAPRVTAATLIAHGDDDTLIPADAARHLFEQMGAREKSWVNVGSGTHGRVLTTAQPLFAEMSSWFLQHLTQR